MQPNISALRHYNLAGFCVERLLNLLTALDHDVEIVVRRKARQRKAGRISVVAAIVAASVLAGCIRPSSATDEHTAAMAANIEAFATTLADADEFSGIVLLTRDGQPLVRRGYGLADRRAGRPDTPETPFMLSSVSKMFTAVVIAKLVERKQLSFNSIHAQSTCRRRYRFRSLVSRLGGAQAGGRLQHLHSDGRWLLDR